MRKDHHDKPICGAALIVTYGNTTQKHRPLDRELTVLGRGRNCDVSLVSPEVAPIHCLIARLADRWLVRDCTGRGGTRINGKSVTDAVLTDGDMLQVGTFSFEVRLPAERAGAAAVGAAAPSVGRYERSRRNLAELALGLRKRLSLANAALRSQEEIDLLADRVRSVRHDLETRGKQLAEAEARLQSQQHELAERAHEVEQECASRRKELEELTAAAPAKAESLGKREAQLASLARKLDRTRKQLHEEARELAQEQARFRQEREAAAQGPEVAQLRQQVETLVRDLAEQKGVCEAQQGELEALRTLGEAQEAVVALSGGAELHGLVESLRQQVRERDALLDKMARRLEQNLPSPDADVEGYEAELNRYRVELERERRELNAQALQLQQRHAEIEQAARETELQMARERAQMARDQAELNRLRQELSRTQNRSAREQEVRDRLAGVMRLKEGVAQTPAPEQPPSAGPHRARLFRRPRHTPA
jgi:pSer/pThr/pTyr-binding forkhead associated (FHA) protein